jgi:hypothetical protein
MRASGSRTEKLLITGMILLVMCWAGPLVYAGDANLQDIRLTKGADFLVVDFSVANCFTPDMNRAVQNGIETTFTFFVKLFEVRKFWWNRKVVDLKISHTIQYDSLKKTFTVIRSENNGKPVVVKDLEKAQALMSRIEGLRIIETSMLQEGRHYQTRMMAELDKIKLPFYLHYVFFFLSLWDFRTNWYTLDFTA